MKLDHTVLSFVFQNIRKWKIKLDVCPPILPHCKIPPPLPYSFPRNSFNWYITLPSLRMTERQTREMWPTFLALQCSAASLRHRKGITRRCLDVSCASSRTTSIANIAVRINSTLQMQDIIPWLCTNLLGNKGYNIFLADAPCTKLLL